MKQYIKDYYDYFSLSPNADTLFDELEFIVNKRLVVAENIHHVFFGSGKYEHIDNYMALSYANHTKAHDEKLKREYLKEIHLQFLENNPY